ncbi:hypothetical protein LTR85_005900 [Meristemomyces frigidus]|nr:hypothetical protein LTR85_005900 [Meristemomyces frigidus]
MDDTLSTHRSTVHCFVRFDLFIKVQLKLVCDLDAGRSAGAVMIRDGERWRPLNEWLHTLPPPTMKEYGKVAIEEQYKCWRRTGRPFRFLDLPKELQRHILLFAVDEHIEPEYDNEWIPKDGGVYQKKGVKLTKGTFRAQERSYRGSYARTNLPPIAPVNLALLGLSKQTRTMALDVLWGDTTKTYRAAPYTGEWATRIEQTMDLVPKARLGFLRRIQLALTNIEYVRLFNVYLPGAVGPGVFSYTYYNEHYLEVWEDLPNLKYLNIHFESTAGSSYSPGSLVATMDLERLPCQKVLLDWIMCYVAEHIIHIPTIELSGSIKTCTKQKWAAILNDRSRTDYLPMLKEQQEAIHALPLSEIPKPYEWKEAFAQYWFDHDDKYVPEPMRSTVYEERDGDGGWGHIA